MGILVGILMGVVLATGIRLSINYIIKKRDYKRYLAAEEERKKERGLI